MAELSSGTSPNGPGYRSRRVPSRRRWTGRRRTGRWRPHHQPVNAQQRYDQRIFHTASRFSRKAATPSVRSSVVNASASCARSASSASGRLMSRVASMAFLPRRMRSGDFPATLCAHSRTILSKLAAGTTALTMFSRCASAASIGSPSIISFSLRCETPGRQGSRRRLPGRPPRSERGLSWSSFPSARAFVAGVQAMVRTTLPKPAPVGRSAGTRHSGPPYSSITIARTRASSTDRRELGLEQATHLGGQVDAVVDGVGDRDDRQVPGTGLDEGRELSATCSGVPAAVTCWNLSGGWL